MNEATERWRMIVAGPDDAIPLDEAALLISAHSRWGCGVAAELRRLDQLATEVGESTADGVSRLLFGTYGIAGDRRTYSDPRNSLLDQVLVRRRGIPITLSVLLIEIARRCGVELRGIGMPGHFLTSDPSVPGSFIDAFDGGRRLDFDACRALYRSARSGDAELTPSMLEPVGRRAILARMLANLDVSFERQRDTRSLVWVTRLRLAIPSIGTAQRVELAERLASFGQFAEAAAALDDLAESRGAGGAQSAFGADELRRRAQALRARFN